MQTIVFICFLLCANAAWLTSGIGVRVLPQLASCHYRVEVRCTKTNEFIGKHDTQGGRSDWCAFVTMCPDKKYTIYVAMLSRDKETELFKVVFEFFRANASKKRYRIS